MNYKKYYKENVSYNFNAEKMQKIVKEQEIEMLKNNLKNQYDKIAYNLFDKVNTKENVCKFIKLIEAELKNRNVNLDFIGKNMKYKKS